jgi:nucleoside-diphosphate-sugar epimerase
VSDAGALRVGVTGAQGYVGSAVARAFAEAGHHVVALTRRPDGVHDHRAYELTATVPPDLLRDIDVVMHCAYDWTPRTWGEIVRVNIEGTRHLLDATVAEGARFTLISSVSAFEGTRQMYGNAKLAAERITLQAGGNAVRLGTVYGGANGGIFGLLLRFANLPVIPVFAADSPQALIRLDNATAALVALAEAATVNGQLIGLASPSTISFGDLMRALSSAKGKPSAIVPVPWLPLYLLLRAAERAGVGLPLRAETVLGLARPAPGLASVDLWRTLGVDIDPPDLTPRSWS